MPRTSVRPRENGGDMPWVCLSWLDRGCPFLLTVCVHHWAHIRHASKIGLMNKWSNKRMNDYIPGGQSFTPEEELAWPTLASSHWENTPGSRACQKAKENGPATSCSSSNPRLSIHVMIFECWLGCGTTRLGILLINCWKPGQTGQQSFLTSPPGPFLNVTTRGRADTHRARTPAFRSWIPFFKGLSKWAFILSFPSHNLRETTTHLCVGNWKAAFWKGAKSWR